MDKIKEDSIFIRNSEKFLSTEIDGETVIMNTKNGRYLGLNSVSTDIWNMLSDQKTFGSILKSLLKDYKVSRKKCELETRELLTFMLKNNIIQLKDIK